MKKGEHVFDLQKGEWVGKGRRALMLGVMNIHCGSVLAARSRSNMVKFLHFASRFVLDVTESKLIRGLPSISQLTLLDADQEARSHCQGAPHLCFRT